MSVGPRKFPLFSLIVCLCGAAALCGLGTWQLERLTWKNNLQRELDQAFAAYGTSPISDDEIRGVTSGHAIRGRVDGFIDFSKAVLFNGRLQDGQSAQAVVVPLTTMADTAVAAEIGCGIQPDIDEVRAIGRKSVIVMGAVREPRWSFASPKNQPEQNQWWRLDHQELGAQWDMPDLQQPVMTIENTKDFVASLNPCVVEKNLRNDHLFYAIFWFTMAGVLLVMWGFRFLKPYLQSA